VSPNGRPDKCGFLYRSNRLNGARPRARAVCVLERKRWQISEDATEEPHRRGLVLLAAFPGFASSEARR